MATFITFILIKKFKITLLLKRFKNFYTVHDLQCYRQIICCTMVSNIIVVCTIYKITMYLRISMGSLHPHEKFESEKRLRLAIIKCIDICLEVILSRLVMLSISRKVFYVYLSFMSG